MHKFEEHESSSSSSSCNNSSSNSPKRVMRVWGYCAVCYASMNKKDAYSKKIVCSICNYGCCSTCKPSGESACTLCRLSSSAAHANSKSHNNEKQLRNTKFLIIGGSIVGLTTALALINKGYNVHLVERRTISGKLTLWKAIINIYGSAQNALRSASPDIFSHENLSKVATETEGTEFLPFPNSDLKSIKMISDSVRDEARFGSPRAFVIIRDTFMEMLLEAIKQHPNRNLLTLEGEKNVSSFRELPDGEDGQRVVVNLDDGTELFADYLIGADGINSMVRNVHFAKEQKAGKVKVGSCGHIQVQGFSQAPFPQGRLPLFEVWGRKGRALMLKAGPYTGWAVNFAGSIKENNYMNSEDEQEAGKQKMLKRFAKYPYIKSFMETSEPMTVNMVQVNRLTNVMKVMNKGRVIIIGDAAHAIANGLGAGACLGIEDAFALAELLSLHTDAKQSESDEVVQQALHEWSPRRCNRAAVISKLSYTTSAMLSNHQGFFISRLRAWIFRRVEKDTDVSDAKRNTLFDPLMYNRTLSTFTLEPQTTWLYD